MSEAAAGTVYAASAVRVRERLFASAPPPSPRTTANDRKYRPPWIYPGLPAPGPTHRSLLHKTTTTYASRPSKAVTHGGPPPTDSSTTANTPSSHPFRSTAPWKWSSRLPSPTSSTRIFVRVSNERWVKAGVEFADGRPQIGAVVTDGLSDWSLAPAPDRAAQRILIRVSRSGNALTIRAKPSDHDDLQLIRVVPFEPELFALAGPYTWAPTQAGLTVRFHSWRSGQPDPVECCSCTPARNRHLA
jgi:hypothetical protein